MLPCNVRLSDLRPHGARVPCAIAGTATAAYKLAKHPAARTTQKHLCWLFCASVDNGWQPVSYDVSV